MILYPCKDSVGISEWMHTEQSSVLPGTKITDSEGRMKARCVLLDGTYSDAEKMIKHMEKLIRARGAKVPVVKLDLEGGKCRCSTSYFYVNIYTII